MKKMKFSLGRVENNVGKGENAGYQHFSPFPTMFSKALCFRVVKSRDRVVKSLFAESVEQDQLKQTSGLILLSTFGCPITGLCQCHLTCLKSV